MGHAQTKAKSKEAHSSNATAANSSGGACKNKRRVVKELQRESNFDMVEVNQLYDIFNEMSGDSITIIMWFFLKCFSFGFYFTKKNERENKKTGDVSFWKKFFFLFLF